MADSPAMVDPVVDALARDLEVDQRVMAWLSHHIRNAVFPLIVPLTAENIPWYTAELRKMRQRLLRLCVAAESINTEGGRARLRAMLAEEATKVGAA